MNNKRYSWPTYILLFFLALCILVWGCYSSHLDKDKFFSVNLTQLLTLSVAFFLSFYMTQLFNKKRRVVDSICKVLDQLEKEVTDSKMYIFSSEEERSDALMQQRRINNHFELLRGCAQEFKFDKTLSMAVKSYDEYKEFYGNHIQDTDYLAKSKNELRRPLDTVANMVTQIKLDISRY